MSSYYNTPRTRNLFDPTSDKPYKLSRSRIENFMNCPRCFYMDRRLGVDRPPGFPFNLNSAVDELLKKEFDLHRADGTMHPLLKEFGIDAIPYRHSEIDAWRDSLRRGIRYLHEPTNLIITGGVDDVWVKPNGELIIADYKATSKSGEVSLNADWQIGYKRQMEIYQWLFRRNGFEVDPTGYFVYCNGRTDSDVFDAKLEFDIKVLPYKGDDSWVEGVIYQIKDSLMQDEIPAADPDCDYCRYRDAVKRIES